MNQNLLSRVLEFLQRKMWNKRWQRAVTCLAAVAVFGVTYALVLPAITMTNVHPTLFAEELSAWSGDELTVRVTAEAEEEKPEQTFVLKTEGEGADLSASYAFNEEGICVITDDEGKEIELHRSIREGKKDVVDYWFTLEPGTKTSFTLSLTDEVDENRFAELVQAVKQDSEEKGDTVETASASDAGKSETAASVARKNSGATASNAAKASVSNADVAEANAAAKADEEKIVTEKDDDGFEQILDGLVVNDLEVEEEESAEQTEIVAKLKVSAGLGKDYENAVKDAEKNADKRGDAELVLAWKDVPASKASGSSLYAYVDGARITVFYDDAAGIPADASLSVEEYEEGSPEYEEYLAQAKDAVAKATGSDASKTVGSARFFDITILDADGNEVEPEAPVKVVISYEEAVSVKNDSDLNVVHFKDEAPELFKPGATNSEESEVKALSFTAESFSVYAIIELTDEIPEGNNLSREFENARYAVTLSFSEKAKIPENAELRVKELTKENAPEEYAENEMLLRAKDKESDILALLDIGFWVGEQEIEPEDTVYVRIKFKETAKYASGDELNILHRTEDKLVPVAAEALDENRETSYKVDSFSVFVITYTPAISWVSYGASHGGDPDWVVRGGTVKTFTSNLPLATAAITGSMAVSNATFTTEYPNRFQKSGSYIQVKLDAQSANQEKTYEGTYTLLWKDIVTLSDGTKADLQCVGSNVKQHGANSQGWASVFHGTGVSQPNDGGTSSDYTYTVMKNGNPVTGYTLLFGVTDIDQPDQLSHTFYKVKKATDGLSELVAVQAKSPGRTYYAEELTPDDAQNGKIQIANTSGQRLYYQADGSMGTTVTPEPVYAKYKVFRSNGTQLGTGAQTATSEGSEASTSPQVSINTDPYVTMTALEYAESITAVKGALSKIYIPNHNFLHFTTGTDGEKRMIAIKNDSSTGNNASGTHATGFIMLCDSAGYTIRYTASGKGVGIGLTSATSYYKIISTTGEGGNIETKDKNLQGDDVTYGPGLLAVPVHKDVTYTMPPKTFYHAKSMTIWDGTQVPEKRTVIPYGDIVDEEGYEAVDGQTYSEKTVEVPYKDESDEYGHQGIESTITYVIRKLSDGTVEGYDAAGTKVFTYSENGGTSTFTDLNRNVTYEFTVSGNGTITYTFKDVVMDHWIDVRWEKDPAAESLVIVKEWQDNGNARSTRPETLKVHAKRTSGEDIGSIVDPETQEEIWKKEFITGTDANIGSTDWVKSGDIWTYTYKVKSGIEDMYIYEDEVTDYTSQNIGEDHKLSVVDYTEEADPATGVITRIYKATISNAIAPGGFDFVKIGEAPYGTGSGEDILLEGAVFKLFTDERCDHPVQKSVDGQMVDVAATSAADGKVTFEDIPCGTYYMKETVSPGDYDDNESVYKVVIHADRATSVITRVKNDPQGSGELSGTVGSYKIQNKLSKHPVRVKKISTTDRNRGIASALFMLYGSDYIVDGKVNENAVPIAINMSAADINTYGSIVQPDQSFYTSSKGNQNNTTSQYGVAPLGTLKAGTYYLVEKKAPNGYDMPADPITVIYVTQEGVRASAFVAGTVRIIDTVTVDNITTYTIKVPNSIGKELPHTGGPGTRLYTLGGIMLLIASALLYGFKMKREERRCS